jgi:uncharacterized protein YcbK (DUF882 family)
MKRRKRGRRAALKLCFAAAVSLLIPYAARSEAAPAARATPSVSVRELSFHNLHTGEDLHVVYWRNGAYDPAALVAINHFFRDYRTGETKAIDPHLLDLLYEIHQALGSTQPLDLISGYRSPTTNGWLVAHTTGVSSHSMHMQGKAADVRLPDIPLATLRDTAKSLHAGGVGFYPASNFVHVDTGRVRYW